MRRRRQASSPRDGASDIVGPGARHRPLAADAGLSADMVLRSDRPEKTTAVAVALLAAPRSAGGGLGTLSAGGRGGTAVTTWANAALCTQTIPVRASVASAVARVQAGTHARPTGRRASPRSVPRRSLAFVNPYTYLLRQHHFRRNDGSFDRVIRPVLLESEFTRRNA